ncbi:hypothetical protein [Pajaroellobacter abortibovis]|uniref:hypothetical protein n=1 Tax=Pajaroellobacter abortibovis TaxID=1882918 RepID=UPI001FE5CD19|nr:hypothetical protein [Pajaroellobacter abortibovis]
MNLLEKDDIFAYKRSIFSTQYCAVDSEEKDKASLEGTDAFTACFPENRIKTPIQRIKQRIRIV